MFRCVLYIRTGYRYTMAVHVYVEHACVVSVHVFCEHLLCVL